MLKLDHVSVAYQAKTVVNNIGFELFSGQIGCLLGPSGCGKTSILRAIAGFETVASGEVYLRDQLVADTGKSLPAEKRKVAVVFQDYALFPHMTIGQNISFGMQDASHQDKQKRLAELLELVELSDCEDRYPHSLSGGQQQRVALIRAMAAKPDLLLLDEPFSSLDADLRSGLAKDLRNILKHENATALLVTHDQHEAFEMADMIGVMNEGKLEQWSDAYSLYHRPASRFVADFIGEGVFLPGVVDEHGSLHTSLGEFPIQPTDNLASGDKAEILIRPDDIVHDDESKNTAKVTSRAFQGAHILYELTLQTPDSERVLCLALSHHDHQINELIGIRLDVKHLILFPTGN